MDVNPRIQLFCTPCSEPKSLAASGRICYPSLRGWQGVTEIGKSRGHMTDSGTSENTVDTPLEVGPGIFWLAERQSSYNLYCNPYLILDGSEAVVIDGASRPDFPAVMMKILQTGISPAAISGVVYQHYDADLCASIPHFESIIGRGDLKIVSHEDNMAFLRHYVVSSKLVTLRDTDNVFTFSSGRTLRFIHIPYSHAASSFVTFDEQSGVLFSGDLMGSYSKRPDPFLDLPKKCKECMDTRECPTPMPRCPLLSILEFHLRAFTSTKALRHALARIAEIPYTMIAPQHGSIIRNPEDAKLIMQKLGALTGVGIDAIVPEPAS